MKKIKYILFVLLMFVFVGHVYANPSFSIQPNKFSIQEGQSVTLNITISNAASWNIKVVSSGNTNGCSNSWADATGDGENTTKSFSTTCKATSTGVINFVVTGDITDASGNNREIYDTTKITVTEYVEPERSSVNTLNSLEVEGYELTPEFDPNVTEYNVTVPAGTESVYINITKKDSKSVANGDFKEVALEEGANRCTITVTAENGSKKTYVVVVTVEDEDPVIVKIDDKEYTIVTNPKQLEVPNGYELSNAKYEDKDIPTLYNEKAKITLVGLKDSDGNIGLYIYNSSEKTFEPYEVIEVNGFTFIVMKPKEELENYSNAKIINIAGKDYTVYYNDVDDIVLIYGMNVATGNVGWYRYDTEEQTFLRFKESKDVEQQPPHSKKDHTLLLAMLFAGCFGISLIVLLILLGMLNSKDKKNKKLVEILESQMPSREEREPEVEIEGTNQLDKKFIELIDKEAEEKRNAVEVDEEALALDQEFEKTQELSKKELKRLAKQLKKDEEEEARALREDFLSTRENEILSDTDILEEIPNSEEVLNESKKKNKKKKK